MERREYVAAAGVSVVIALSGCLGDSSDSTDGSAADVEDYDTDDAESVVEAWYATTSTGDTEGRLSLMHSEFRGWFEDWDGDVEQLLDPFGTDIEFQIDVESIEIVEENLDTDTIVEEFPGVHRGETSHEGDRIILSVESIGDDDTLLFEIDYTIKYNIQGERREVESSAKMLLVAEAGEWTVFSYTSRGDE